MPMLPVPAFVALVLAYLALRTLLSQGRALLVLFLSACALQSLLVALVGGYGVEALRRVLPFTAAAIPPLAWITFQDALIGHLPPRRVVWHALGPGFAFFCQIFAPQTSDVVVPLIFAGYGIAILGHLHATTDIPLARLNAAETTSRIWRALGWALSPRPSATS